MLVPVVEATQRWRGADTLITADAGYHSEANLAQLAERGIPALIADKDMRRRDERVDTQDRYRALPDPLPDKTAWGATASPAVFTPSDFTYDPDARTCLCPAGKFLYRKGRANVTNGFVGEHFPWCPRGLGRTQVIAGPRRRCGHRASTS